MFRRLFQCLVLGCLLGIQTANAASAKVVKVLSHLVDSQGRHAVSPSHFDRDAYQAHLRSNPEKIAGLRYDIQWRSRLVKVPELEMRLELRGEKLPIDQSVTLSRKVDVRRLDLLSSWAQIALTREEFDRVGDVIAWRVTIWDGSVMMAEEKSFLW